MHVGVEVGGVRAEGLDREDETWCDVAPIEDRADARNDRVAGRGGEQAEQPALALEQSPQHARDRQHEVTVRDRLEDLGDDVLGKQRRALGLAARASDPLEAALEPAAGEVGLDGRGNDPLRSDPSRAS